MVVRALVLLISAGLLVAAKHPQKPADGQADNASAGIKATIYADPENVLEVVGSDLQGHYIVVQLQLTPKAKLPVSLDDFMLRTDKDGERSHPFKPTQIAGDGALIISETVDGGGGAHGGDPTGPVWGGIPGMGRGPRNGGGVGNGANTTGGKATTQAATGKKNPLLDVLAAKMLPEKETDQPLIGLLYFPMEKQKVKDLELIYTTPTGKLSVRFR
jgi:hypothetical protein